MYIYIYIHIYTHTKLLGIHMSILISNDCYAFSCEHLLIAMRDTSVCTFKYSYSTTVTHIYVNTQNARQDGYVYTHAHA